MFVIGQTPRERKLKFLLLLLLLLLLFGAYHFEESSAFIAEWLSQ